jgi:hypothetical protein
MGLLDAILGTGGGLLGGGQQQTVQQPEQVAGAGFGDRLRSLLASDSYLGFMSGLASGTSTADSFARAGLGYSAGRKADQSAADDKARRDQLNAWIKAKSAGMAPEDAALLEANPEMAANYASDVLKPKEYKAPNQGEMERAYFKEVTDGTFSGTLRDYKAAWDGAGAKAAGGPKYGNTPIYGQDADGNTVILQPGDNGTLIQPQIPAGVKVNPGIKFNNLGTSIEGTDRFGNHVVNMQKDVAGVASQGAIGAAQGTAAAMLPAAMQQAALVDKQITDLEADPALPSVLGTWGGNTPAIFPAARAVQAKIDQIKSQTFLQGYQMLKGGGAITEIEGLKAERAMARLDQAQSPEDFKAALDDFNAAVQQGVAKLQALSGQQGQPVPQGPQPDAEGWHDVGGGVRIRQVQ